MATLCLTPINYSLCEHAAMKLSYQRNNSDTDVGILLYNILYGPTVDTVVTSVNTTEYGFYNFTSDRNETSLCLYFLGISMIANRQKYEVHQICDVKKLPLEKKHSLIFYLAGGYTLHSSCFVSSIDNNRLLEYLRRD